MKSQTMADLAVGDSTQTRKTVTETDVALFAAISGDFNPVHMDSEYAKTTPFGARVAHGPLTLALCAGPLGTEMPGVGTVAVRNEIDYKAPVYIGDTITTRLTVSELDAERNHAKIGIVWTNQDGTVVAEGCAVVKPPKTAVEI